MDPLLKAKLQKQRYHIVGEHGGVKVCHWTKESLLRDRQCYKGKFYGVASHNCMQMSPVVDQCNLACSYCWREPHMDTLRRPCWDTHMDHFAFGVDAFGAKGLFFNTVLVHVCVHVWVRCLIPKCNCWTRERTPLMTHV